MNTPPLIALVGSVDYRAKIKAVAADLEAEVVWELPLKGVIARVVELRPQVVIVELSHHPAHWSAVVSALKANPATRRLAVLGFTEPLTPDLITQAQNVLVDEIFAAHDSRAGILTTLKDRIIAHARRADADIQTALGIPCQEPMPQLVYNGIRQFNAGEYYQAHEDLEHAWMAEAGVVRNLYQGILQVGVAYYQIQRQNYWGAIKMFLRAFQWLEAMPDICHGIDIAQLRADARHVWQTLEQLKPDHIADFDTQLFKPLKFDSAYLPKDTPAP